MNPVLLVIAGPNGAGKTTVTVKLRSERWSDNVEYLNPDDIARDRFGDWNSPEASLKAARWTTERRQELLAQHAGIAFETVKSHAKNIYAKLGAGNRAEAVSKAERFGFI